MSGRKFIALLVVVFAVSLAIYLFTTPRGNQIPLVGIIDGNDVVVSPMITGRLIRLNVDEGSVVKKGEWIAELDPSELEATVAAQTANINAIASRVAANQKSLAVTNDQTAAQIDQAQATVTATQSQLQQAQATLWRDQLDDQRAVALYQGGIGTAQDRDHADAAVRADQAAVKALEDQVKAQRAALALARANRKQLDVIQSQIADMKAQWAQARALRDQAATQLGYTRIYAPIDGIVSVRVAKQGEVVSAGSPIAIVVDVDHLWVRADVEETYIDSVRFGERLAVELPSGDRLEGTVFFKGVEGDFATQRDVSRTKRDIKTFAIKIAVPNPGRRLFTGMTATVLLPPPARASRSGWLGLIESRMRPGR
ncbi:MAG TPA: efflux RND transporter periplasmic adaptor subunit [Candidatus Acidoferrales bacterium]|nr:efflux RND transporter periplasmic adaptor subunit [Candidatus Acidoferrales bacterium]